MSAHDAVVFRTSWGVGQWQTVTAGFGFYCDYIGTDDEARALGDFITVCLRNGQYVIVRPKSTTASDAPTQ